MLTHQPFRANHRSLELPADLNLSIDRVRFQIGVERIPGCWCSPPHAPSRVPRRSFPDQRCRPATSRSCSRPSAAGSCSRQSVRHPGTIPNCGSIAQSWSVAGTCKRSATKGASLPFFFPRCSKRSSVVRPNGASLGPVSGRRRWACPTGAMVASYLARVADLSVTQLEWRMRKVFKATVGMTPGACRHG